MIGGFFYRCLVCLLLLGGVGLSSAWGQAPRLEAEAERVDYAEDIAPLLQRRCAECHGADAQESGFRVDVPQRLLRGGDSGEAAVAPGAPEKSFILQVVTGQADFVMPPEEPRLTDSEVALIQRWISQGAVFPAGALAHPEQLEHWSFLPLSPPDAELLRHVDRSAADASPIDVLLEKRLSEHGLQFTEPADRRILIRRLFLVMHGLPPTPQQVQRFVDDQDPLAWEHLVEEVLASPRYGERWARHWLDLVRFGETHGFETNRERPHAWRYRDWVIAAFNDDKPYDQFVREQLAGDALGEPVAAGFLVAGPHDLVKSPDINLTLMQRQDELADLINATGTAFMGLSLGCARCHNHKFDPITQQDYYSIQAVFAGVQHGDRPLPLTPEQQALCESLDQRIMQLRGNLAQFIPPAAAGAPLADDARAAFRPAVEAGLNVESFPAVLADRVRFTVLATNNSSEPCLDELELLADGRNVALASLGAVASCSSTLPGYAIHQLRHIHDGLYGNDHSWISNEPGSGWIEIRLPQEQLIDGIRWSRDREGGFRDRVATRYLIQAALGDAPWRTVASSDDRLPSAGDSPAEPVAYRFTDVSDQRAQQGRAWWAELQEALQQRKGASQAPLAYAGLFEEPGPTHRLYRGDPLAQRQQVAPDAIAALGCSLDLPADAPEQLRRLEFAEWITRPDHPLTARVAVNRLWQYHFGAGLVDTPNDFGANGVPPTHPELLDWLAQALIQHQWSLKHVHRLILCSRAWRQSSRPHPLSLQVDAASRLLWRFPPRRLEAEAIRDCVLAASGVLDLQAGGPGFSGFEVELENVRHFFAKKSFGPDDWRRMIYMTKVRQEQEAVFGVFDCPDASQVAPKRSRSTTPLQALNLLNSRFVLQQADLLAARLQRQAPHDLQGQLEDAFQICLGRSASPSELQESAEFVRQQGLPAFCRVVFNSNEFLFIP